MNPKIANSLLPIQPIHYPLDGIVCVPGSKSITNRALLIASLAQGATTLSNALFSDDTEYFTNALLALGFNIARDPQKKCMVITGLGGHIPAKQADLYIGNAGTAARFLTAFLTLGSGTFSVNGNSRMRERPIGDLVSALVQLGADVKAVNHEVVAQCPPVKIIASGLPGGKTKVSGNISSQFLSALLMAAPYARKPVEIVLTSELNSKPYIDLTLALMADFGVGVIHAEYRKFLISPARYYPKLTYTIESDASAASYFFAAPAICGGKLRVENINRASRQGDIVFLNVLEKMGCVISENISSIQVSAPKELKGINIDMRDIPDTAQTLAVIAPFASSPTRITGIASARLKETDRIMATCTELRKIGVKVDEYDDGMTIFPTRDFHPALKLTEDHRMAMAFALVGLRVPGITLENPGCISKTFPGFFKELDKLQ